MDLGKVYFNRHGRMRRVPYFWYSAALYLPYFLFSIWLINRLGPVAYFLTFGLSAIMAYPQYCLMTKRLQDFNQSHNWAIAVLIAGTGSTIAFHFPQTADASDVLGLICSGVALCILFIPGTLKENEYGLRPN
jgi:uncharacterized membrane protein YhaH (DUF805 family)